MPRRFFRRLPQGGELFGAPLVSIRASKLSQVSPSYLGENPPPLLLRPPPRWWLCVPSVCWQEKTQRSPRLPADPFLGSVPIPIRSCHGQAPPHIRRGPESLQKINDSMIFILYVVVCVRVVSSPLFTNRKKTVLCSPRNYALPWKDLERTSTFGAELNFAVLQIFLVLQFGFFPLPPAHHCLLDSWNVRETPGIIGCQIGPAFSRSRRSWDSSVLGVSRPAATSAPPRSVSFCHPE